MLVTHKEIVDAYHAGEDVLVLYRRRRMLLDYFVTIPSLSLAFLATLYILKSAAGIDLFEFHLQDLFF